MNSRAGYCHPKNVLRYIAISKKKQEKKLGSFFSSLKLNYTNIISRKRKSTTLRINKTPLPNGGKNTDLYLIPEIISCMKVGEKVVFVVVYVFMYMYRKLQTLNTNIKTTRNMFISQA